MAKTSLKYEQPSRASQVLVLGFSVAVAFMAGWLVLTIMLGNSGTTMVATADDEVPAMPTKQPPRVETQRITVSPPIVAPRQLLSPQADPGSWPGAAPQGRPGRSACGRHQDRFARGGCQAFRGGSGLATAGSRGDGAGNDPGGAIADGRRVDQ